MWLVVMPWNMLKAGLGNAYNLVGNLVEKPQTGGTLTADVYKMYFHPTNVNYLIYEPGAVLKLKEMQCHQTGDQYHLKELRMCLPWPQEHLKPCTFWLLFLFGLSSVGLNVCIESGKLCLWSIPHSLCAFFTLQVSDYSFSLNKFSQWKLSQILVWHYIHSIW